MTICCTHTICSLIKMLYWMCDKSGVGPTWPQLEHAIRRNFGGLDADDFDPVKEFMAGIPDREVPFRPNMTNIPKIVSLRAILTDRAHHRCLIF